MAESAPQAFCHLTVDSTCYYDVPIIEEVTAVAEGYCVKCKAKKEIAFPQAVTMKNGRPAIKGKCPTCGTGIMLIQGSKK